MSYMPQALPDKQHLALSPDLAKIESFDDVRRYVESMDFSWQKYKMVSDRFVVGWSMEKLNFHERQYKNMLLLWRKYPQQDFAPPEEVDDFWHGHILDTRRYFNDSMKIFGEYHHHFPYFGMRGETDRRKLEAAFINLQRIYKDEFGDWLRNWE
jgi:hypothetical protein